MCKSEPVYVLDDLKRMYYIMSAVIYDLDILVMDLSEQLCVGQEMQALWRKKAEKGRDTTYKQHLMQLQSSRAKDIFSVDDLCERAEKIKTAMEMFIPLELRMALTEAAQKDYCFYRSCGYGKYWNEVELPEIVVILFERFRELVKSDCNGIYAVAVYDMSDMEIAFQEEQQLDDLINQYDLEPCEKMIKSDGVWSCY